MVGGGSTTNNLLSGGDGNDLVTYQDEVGAIAYNNGLVQRSSGATDALNGIESITGTKFDDKFTLEGPLGGIIDGREGNDSVTYTGSELVYDQKNGAMWNKEGTSHDTLKNIEALDAKYATLVVANDNYQLIKSKVA